MKEHRTFVFRTVMVSKNSNGLGSSLVSNDDAFAYDLFISKMKLI